MPERITSLSIQFYEHHPIASVILVSGNTHKNSIVPNGDTEFKTKILFSLIILTCSFTLLFFFFFFLV